MIRTKFLDSGRGRFLSGDEPLAEVDYSLRVWRRYHVSQAGGVEEESPGLFDSEGEWQVVGERCEALNDNTEVTFELEDGHRVPAKILRSLWGTEGSFYLEGNGAQVLSGEDG